MRKAAISVLAGLVGALSIIGLITVVSYRVDGPCEEMQRLPRNPDDVERLRSAETLRCSFEDFATEIVFDLVNHETGTARLVGNAGTAPVIAISGGGGVSFIEITPIGNVNMTTVYAWRNAEFGFVAVMSRHTTVGGPSPSQLQGSCRILM